MNKSKRPKIHKKTNVNKLQYEVKALKAELYRTQYDNRAIIDGLQRRLATSERLAYDGAGAPRMTRWEGPFPSALDPSFEIAHGHAKECLVSVYVDREIQADLRRSAAYDTYLRAELYERVRYGLEARLPIYTQTDRRTGTSRLMVRFWLLHVDPPKTTDE